MNINVIIDSLGQTTIGNTIVDNINGHFMIFWITFMNTFSSRRWNKIYMSTF